MVPEMTNDELSTTRVSVHARWRWHGCILSLGSDNLSMKGSNCVPTVERRRRDKINNWIVQLSKAIPDCNIDYTKAGQVGPPQVT